MSVIVLFASPSLVSTPNPTPTAHRHFPDPAVRAFALQRLERAGDDELELFLLQLVQLLRYEPWAEARGAAVGGSSNSGGSAEEPSQPSPSPSLNVPPLARLLIDRACRSLALGNALFWFLTAEMQTDRVLGYVAWRGSDNTQA